MCSVSALLLLLLQITPQILGWLAPPSYRITRDPPSIALRWLHVLNVTDYYPDAKSTPCCKDTLRAGTCQLMASYNPDRFLHQCRTNADFSFIQCCASCHFADGIKLKNSDGLVFPTPESLYDYDVDRLLLSRGGHCTDRRSIRYCKEMNQKDDVTGSMDRFRDSPCEPTIFSFRVCRRTCGYCSTSRASAIIKYNAYVAQDPNRCQYLY